MKKITTALIGYGLSGREFHLPQLMNNPHYTLKTVLTSNPNNQQQIKKISLEIEIVTDYDLVLKDPQIDLIVLAVSNDVHYEYTKKALLNNKHVICEKPFVKTSKEANYLFELAKKKGLMLRVFHNRKYDGDILTLEKVLHEQPMGKIVSFHARFDRYVPVIKDNWRHKTGHMSGIYYDLAPHLVHHCVRLFGEPRSVFNQVFLDRPNSQTDDHFEMVLNYEHMTCFIGAEPYEREAIPKLKLVGTEATYVKYGFDVPDVVVSKTDEFQSSGLKSVFIKSPGNIESIPLIQGKHYAFYNQLYEDITTPLVTDIEAIHALSVIKIMEKGHISSMKKRIIQL